MQIDFSAAFDRVSHSGLLYKLRDVGVGGAVFDINAGFLVVKCRGLLLIVSAMRVLR